MQMRQSVRDVAKMYPTAIISGRGREKVEDFVKLKELYYAGSHGLDIVGPRVRHLSTWPTLLLAAEQLPLLSENGWS